MTIQKITLEELDALKFEINRQVTEKPEAVHYISNKELQVEFLAYHKKKLEWAEQGRETRPPLSEAIGKAIMMIAQRRTYSRNFIGYTQMWKESMIDDAVEACVRYVHNYNPEKYDNPFAYVTQIVNNALINRIRIEKTHLYIKYKAFDNAGGFSAFMDDNVGDTDVTILNETNEMYADHLKYIADFEEKYLTKKPKDEIEECDGVLQFLTEEYV